MVVSLIVWLQSTHQVSKADLLLLRLLLLLTHFEVDIKLVWTQLTLGY